MTSPRQDDAKVQQIRDAAKKLFLRHGFGRVSTAALAREAGVSKETLYSRYPNKDAVLSDVLEHLIHLGRTGPARAPSIATRADLERALFEFAHEFTTRVMHPDYVELVRIVITESPRMPHIGQILRKAVPERALREVAVILADAKRSELVSDNVDLGVAARMFVGPLALQVVANRLLVAPPDDDSATADLDLAAHVELFLSGVSPVRQEEP